MTVVPFATADTVTVVVFRTGIVVRLNDWEVWPAGIVTVAGTVPAAGVSEESVTTYPPVGAAPEIVTVPTDSDPPTKVVGLMTRDVGTGAVTVRAAFALAPYAEAVMFAVAFAALAVVFTVKVAELEPTGIVTVAGTVAAALSDAKLIVYAKVAFPLIVTVPCEVRPPATEVGFNVTVEMPGEELIVKVAFAD